MRKKILVVILVLVVGGLTYGVSTNYPKLGIVSAYAAKKMCSCTFIAERSQESIQNEDLALSPLSLSETVINREQKSATASIFGMKSKTAEYRGKLGCVLVHGEDDYKVHFPKIVLPIDTSAAKPFPYGDKIVQSRVQGVDYKKLNLAADAAFDPNNEMTQLKTRSLLVLHKDSILLERYAKGYDSSTEILGWSMTKSLMNTWIGMLVKDGKVDIKQKDLFEDWKNDERKSISINDLLQMQSGLKWEEVYSEISPATKMLYNSEDNGKVALQLPLEFPPGTYWEYSSGTSNIISKYLRNQYSSHDDYLLFPHERIFQKLNMKSAVLEVDEAGGYIGSSYCYATTRDWARFGTLYLRDGVWNNERLLPEGWVDYTKTPAKNSNGNYGAHFWTNASPKFHKDAPEDMFSANGYEGQRVFIIPSKDLIIVRMGLSENFDFNTLIKNICDSIET
ncbi:MAG: serine hydrolase [Saprospiraceae bacterium]|nr:serine hydrolase [Saprospiraceae bacterium]